MEKKVNHIIRLIINLSENDLQKFAQRENIYKDRNKKIKKLLLRIKKMI